MESGPLILAPCGRVDEHSVSLGRALRSGRNLEGGGEEEGSKKGWLEQVPLWPATCPLSGPEPPTASRAQLGEARVGLVI